MRASKKPKVLKIALIKYHQSNKCADIEIIGRSGIWSNTMKADVTPLVLRGFSSKGAPI